jgi:hypothetical protein
VFRVSDIPLTITSYYVSGCVTTYNSRLSATFPDTTCGKTLVRSNAIQATWLIRAAFRTAPRYNPITWVMPTCSASSNRLSRFLPS